MIRPERISPSLTLVLAAAVLVACAGTAAAKSYSADRFDVTARLLPDRSLAIEEQIVFRFEGGDYTYVFREVPTDRTDGIHDLEAAMDGVPFRVGAGPGSIEVREGRSVRVTWRFAPARGTHAFTLRYRLAGVITREGAENVLAWHALPREHEYRIGDAHMLVRLPPGARLAVPPSFSPASAEVGVAYAPDGQTAEHIVAAAKGLGRNDSIRLDMRLASAGFTSDAPAWQRAAAERSRRGPWLLLVAVAVMVLGVGWLAAFRSAWRRSSDGTRGAASHGAAPPHPALPVAIASRLAGTAASGPPFAATMVDLAGRGVIAIEQASEGRRLRGRRFVARLAKEPPGLRTHEAAWLDVAFGTPRGAEVRLEQLQRRFARARNAFKRAVADEMRQSGLVDPERVSARGSLVRAAIVIALLAVATVGVAIALVGRFGGWAAVLPISLAVVAAVYAIAAGTFSIFTREGERLAGQWKAYFSEVRRLAKDKHGEPASMSADWLAYAVAAGVGAACVRKLAATPGRYAPPAWFHAAAGVEADHGAAFVAFLGTHASTSDGGGGAGAGGGGGAAGGGGSGAG